MEKRKIEKIKRYGLSWVIVLVFDTAEDANSFADTEGLNARIADGKYTTTVRIED